MYSKRFSIPIIILIVLYVLSAIYVAGRVDKQGNDALLLSKLSGYTDIVEKSFDKGTLNEAITILPVEVRITIMDETGKVIYDTDIKNVDKLENHLRRPEIMAGGYTGEGNNIRRSSTTNIKYLYYARFDGKHYIRTAIPHQYEARNNIGLPRLFIIISVLVLLLLVYRLFMVSKRYDQAISQLKRLSKDIADGAPSQTLNFPADELGDISKQLMVIVEQKEEARRAIEEARERLIHHFKLSNIGIALFNAKGETDFTNSHFIQFANMLTPHPMTDVRQLLDDPKMVTIKRFLDDDYNPRVQSTSTTIQQNNNIFEVKALRSGNQGYEITIANITELEKARILKQEMTSNITHEIRTPLSSIRGYLETLRFMNLSDEKRNEFIDKAYQQSIRLSDMMEDIRLISKIDEESSPFHFEEVDLYLTAEEVRIAYQDQLEKNGSRFVNKLPSHLTIHGNPSLLYSIVQNLVENSLRYGGQGTELVFDCYHQDQSYVYLSYYDTGKGLPEQHLNRIFERFYRADEGRTRANGGSGLGLSIVKNAIHLHSGQVQARTHSSGGLEILFTLHK